MSAGSPLAGPVGAQLHDRAVAAVLAAQRLLGEEPDHAAADDPQRRRELIEALDRRLERDGGGRPPAAVTERQAALERVHGRFTARFEALADARRAVDGLREITSPAAILAAAPAALCRASNFERAVLSRVGGGRMVAEAVHVRDDRRAGGELLAALRAEPVALEHPLIETELLRRRRATIVDGAEVHPRVDRRLAGIMRWSAYAAAPLVVGTTVAGVMHADRGPAGRLDVLDRDVLWEFTSGLAQAYESASLRRTLRDERQEMRRFLEWLGAQSGELTDAPIRLATVQRPPRPPLLEPEPPTGTTARDDRAVFEGLLTRRELDVLRLVADGQSNKAIADALVISDGTVKFHVNSILRKLRVANRAEAVARYLRLLGMRAP